MRKIYTGVLLYWVAYLSRLAKGIGASPDKRSYDFSATIVLCCLMCFGSTTQAADNLTISKTITTVPAKPGDVITYQITYTNLNPLTTATLITVVDYLPSSDYFTYTGSSGAGVYNSVTRTLTWTGLSLAANSSAILTVSGVVGKLGGPTGAYDMSSYYLMNGSGTATISNNASVQNPTMASPTYLASPSTISITQSCGGSLPATFTGYIKSSTNSEIFYLVNITNNGSITDKFSLSLNTPGSGELMNSYIETSAGATLSVTPWIQAGSNYSFVVRMKTLPGTNPATVNLTNLTAVSTVCGTSAVSAISTYVYGAQPPSGSNCDLQITKTASANPVTVNTNFTYTITVVNNSASQAANNVLLIDNVPASLTIVSYSGSSGTTVSNPSANQIRLLKSQQKSSDIPITLTITVKPGCTAVPSVTNTAIVSSSTPDGTSGNDQASVTTTINSTLASPTGSGATVCSGSTATLSASSTVTPAGYSWYTTPTGGTSTASGSSFTTGAITASTTYYVSVYNTTNPSCESGRTAVTASVAPNPVITIQPSSQSVCDGTNVSFSVTATGSSLSYQWQVNSGSGYANISNNSTYSGAATASLTVSAASSAVNSYVYRCLVASGVCTGIPTNAATLTVKSPATWLGINTSWNDPQNWCGNAVPTSSSNVVIPVVATNNYPLLVATGYCNDITIDASASLTISNGVLQVAGNISNTGTIHGATAGLVLNGTNAQTIPANTFSGNSLYDLIISNSKGSVTLLGELDIYGSVTFTGTGKTLFTNDFLTLKSTSVNTARVGDLSNNNISGKVTVERYVSARKAWRLLSVPTNTTQTVKAAWQEGAANGASNPVPGFGTQITSERSTWATDGFDLKSVQPSMKVFNPATGNYDGISATNAPFNNFDKGFMIFIRGDRAATGVASPVTATLLRTKGPLFIGDRPAVSIPPDKFGTIANPYASAIDVRNLTRTGLKDFYYLWDPNLSGTYGFGGFQTLSYDAGDYVITPGGGSYGAAGSIQNLVSSGQAFFLQAGASGGSITMLEAAKTAGSPQVTTPTGLPAPALRVTMSGINNDGTTYTADGVLVNFSATHSNLVDENDAIKSGNTSENLGILSKNKLLVVERRALPLPQDTIYLNLTGVRYQTYLLNIQGRSLNTYGIQGWLEDDYLKTRTALNLDGNLNLDIQFTTVVASRAANRFRIVFEQQDVLPVSLLNFYGKSRDDDAVLGWTVTNSIEVDSFLVERSSDGLNFGQVGNIAASTSKKYNFRDQTPLEGTNYYRLTIFSKGNHITTSNIVSVTFHRLPVTFNVVENPVIGHRLKFSLTNFSGEASYQILDNSGHQIASGRVHSAFTPQSIELSPGIRGLALIRIKLADGTEFMRKFIVL